MTDIETTIHGIPARIEDIEIYEGEVDHYVICDRKGYPAPWLEQKLSNRDLRDLEDEIIDVLKKEYEEQKAAAQYDKWLEKKYGY